jgi:putative transposase
MCRVLDVSISGYYAWCKRLTSEHSRKDAELAEQVNIVFQANRGVYGSPRVHAELQAQGIKCARKRVARLMREQELFAKRPRHRTVTTQSDPEAKVAPNLLQRDESRRTTQHQMGGRHHVHLDGRGLVVPGRGLRPVFTHV